MATATALHTAPADIRPGALAHPVDMIPAGLSAVERHEYRRAHARACVTFNRKNGGAGITAEEYGGTWPEPGTAADRELAGILARRGAEHRAAQWPVAHAAGMRALRKYLRDHGQPDRAAAIVDPAKPAKRAGRRNLAAVAPAPEPASTDTADDTTAEPADTAPELTESRPGMPACGAGATHPASGTTVECSRDRGHDGAHAAHGGPGWNNAAGIVHTWPAGDNGGTVTDDDMPAEVLAGVDSGRVTVVHVGPWPATPGAAVAVPELAPEPTPAELERTAEPEPEPADDTAPEVRPLSDVSAAVAIGRHLRDTWPDPIVTRADRAAVRRELANRLRACGIVPAGMAWRMAADTATGTDTAGGDAR